MGRNAQLCAWGDCFKSTDKPQKFGRRRRIDPELQSPLLKSGHSGKLCNAHWHMWCQHNASGSATEPTQPTVVESNGMHALLSAAAAASPPSSSPSSSCSLPALVNSQPLPPAPGPRVPALSAAASPRRALSDVNLNYTPQRRDTRRHSTPLKKKQHVVRVFSAAQTDAERQAVTDQFGLTTYDVQRYAATIAKNDQLPQGRRRPLTARRLPGAGKKRALSETQEAELDQWVMSKRRCEARLAVSERDIQLEARAVGLSDFGQRFVE
jgi:hypothetical protein